MAKTRISIVKKLLLGLLTAILITLAGMLLLAAALIYLKMDDGLLTVLNQLVKALAIVGGVCAAVRRGGNRGLATGVEIALVYAAAGYAVYLLLGGGSFSVGNMLGEMLLGSAVGALTGAVRANLHPRRAKVAQA